MNFVMNNNESNENLKNETNKKIKNIIFDLGNVILNFDKDFIISKFTDSKEEARYIKEQIWNLPEWGKFDLGEITNKDVVDIINKKNHNKYKKLTENYVMNWYKQELFNRETANLAKKLKEKGYKIYIISNLDTYAWNYIKEDEFFKECSGVVISSLEHIKKPDERIFKLFLERYKLDPEECLFIDDDDTGRSYETANKIGIKGRRIEPNQIEDVKRLLLEYDIEC